MLRRRKRLKGISLNILIPNLITVLALCAGMTGVRFALQEKWEFAAGAIAIAAVLDALDGRMARLLKASSKFGAELDSLSDFISFGVAPAIILFIWAAEGQGMEGLGWMAALFYATCMGLRLARFNTMLEEEDQPPFAPNFFTGVPAPAAAGMALLPLMLSFQIDADILSHPLLVAVWSISVGLLMVSKIPTFSFKRAKIPNKYVLSILIVAGLIIASVASDPWPTIAGVVLIYTISIPFSAQSYVKQHKAWELRKSQQQEQAPASDEDNAT